LALSVQRRRSSVGDLRERGIEALAVCALLARLGTADPVEPVTALQALIASVDFSRIGRAAARFSEEELAQLSARTLHAMPYEAMQARLAALDADLGEPFWFAVRGNLATLADVADWVAVVRGPITPQLEDVAFLAEAAASLPAEPWDEAMWKAWTSMLATASGRKGRALFHPLRLALTAREKGPEMAKLLPLIGRTKAAARLRGQAA
jgi:glutamyl-tRNA synthetase